MSTSPSQAPVSNRLATKLNWWFGRLVTPVAFLIVGITLIVGMGFAQRSGWISAGSIAGSGGNGDQQVHTCPMHPQIRQPGPGRCPICGMALVPASGGSADLDAMSVKIEPAQRRLSNIRVEAVKRQTVSATIQTVGSIAIDESRMATIASYIDGRLERLFADYTGVDVGKKDHLAVVYSPNLYSAQVEYLETRKSLRQMNGTLAAVRDAQQNLAKSARQRLVELGMTEAQIQSLEKTGKAKSRLTIYAPMGGTVIEKLAVEGNYVKAGEPIYRIADLSTVWLVLELYPRDAARIRFGQRVEAKLQSIPREVFKGRVAFIDPKVNKKKRTVAVRVEFFNNDRRLRPGDYANAVIQLPIGQEGEVYDSELAGRWISPMHPQIISDKPGKCTICGMPLVPTSRYGYAKVPVKQPTSLYVPRTALLMAGSSSVVYVEIEPGRFQIRPVVLGPILRDKVIIIGGLEEGEKVATAGNFLIDSQMQLAGKPSLIDPTRAIVAQRIRKKPLALQHIHVVQVPGKAGRQVESLFASYFVVQAALSQDKKPPQRHSVALHQMAKSLQVNPAIPQAAREQLKAIAGHSEHLHHLDLDKARHEAFRPISHAMVTLASMIRGDGAKAKFHHMFCPMVKGGSGDWLQSTTTLRNPYYGSEMLQCGQEVREFPTAGRNKAKDGKSLPPAKKSEG